MCEFAEYLKSRINFLARQRFKTFRPKALHRKRSHHPAVEKRPLDHLAVQVFLGSDVPHESSGERIAGSGRVFDFFNRQRRCPKRVTPDSKRAFTEEDGRTI